MSNRTADLRTALSNGPVSDFVDSVAQDLMDAHALALSQRDTRITTLTTLVDGLRDRINILEARLDAQARDDRYKLTRANIINLMQELGIYEE